MKDHRKSLYVAFTCGRADCSGCGAEKYSTTLEVAVVGEPDVSCISDKLVVVVSSIEEPKSMYSLVGRLLSLLTSTRLLLFLLLLLLFVEGIRKTLVLTPTDGASCEENGGKMLCCCSGCCCCRAKLRIEVLTERERRDDADAPSVSSAD